MKVIGWIVVLMIVGSGVASAEEYTNCTVVQLCPRDRCSYMKTNDNALKAQTFSRKCKEWADEQGATFIDYVPGPWPKCKMAMKFEGKIDCSTL